MFWRFSSSFRDFFEPGETLCLAFRFEPSRAPSVGKEIPSRFFEGVNEKNKNSFEKNIYIKSRRPSFIEGVAGGRRKNISLCEPRRIRELFTLSLPLEPRCGLCVVCFRSLPHFTSLKFTCCAVYFRLNKMPSVVDNGLIADF